MARSNIRRSSALAATRGLQLLSLALIAGGVAAATMPGRDPGKEPDVVDPGTEPVDTPGITQAPPVDFEVIAANLGAWDKEPVAPEPPKMVPGTPEIVEAPVSNLRFLGAITEPKRRLAVLAIDAAQKILAEGQEYDAYKVIEVGDTWARVSVRGVEQRVEKAKSAPLLSSLSSAPTQPTELGYMDPGVQSQLAEQDEYARKYAQEGLTRAIPVNTTAGANGMTTSIPGGPSAKAMEAMRRERERARAMPTGADGNVADSTGDMDATGAGGGATRGGAAGGAASGGGTVSGGSAADGSPR